MEHAPRMLGAIGQERAGARQRAERRAEPTEKAPAAAAAKEKEQDLDKRIERIIERKLGQARNARAGQGRGPAADLRGSRGLAGPKRPDAGRLRPRDGSGPRDGMGPRRGMDGRGQWGDRWQGRGRVDGRRGPAARGAVGAYGFGRGAARGQAWDGPQRWDRQQRWDAPRGWGDRGRWSGQGRGLGRPGLGRRGTAGPGPAAMLDVNRDGRIDAAELDRLIEKLKDVRARAGEKGISLEAFRDLMMPGRGLGQGTGAQRPSWQGRGGPDVDIEKGVKSRPDRRPARDGAMRRPRAQSR